MEPMVASLLGFVVLGEYMHADTAVAAILAIALVATVAAAVALARSAADSEEVVATTT
jgi:threonine/homoserine efflux transporter RhtA